MDLSLEIGSLRLPNPLIAASGCFGYGVACEVSVERVMGCGLGGCYSCVVPVRTAGGSFHHVRSCISGPVFRAEDIKW